MSNTQNTVTDIKTQIIGLLYQVTDKKALEDIRKVARDRHEHLGSLVKFELAPGVKVKISGGKNQLDDIGEVVKVNRTRALCNIEGKHGQWNVPFSMLTAI